MAIGDTPPGGEGAVAAAVLAGGASRRMGRDKATLPVDGVELAVRVVATAARVAAPVVLVAPAGHPAEALGRRLGAAVVTDPGAGPLAALAAALAALRAPYVLALAADHPCLQVGLLARLLAEREAGQAVACRRGGALEPLVAVWQREPALAAARSHLEAGRDLSLRGLLAALATRVLEEPVWRPLDPEGLSFLDLDDPADLAAFVGSAGREGRRPSTP
jgi:molybdenum cofactor guanylyltransferase